MANVKVAIRVRPLNARESKDGGRLAVQVEGNLVRIKKTKLDGRLDPPGDSREKFLEFGFDYCYWSVAPEETHYASQEEVFQDLGVSVLAGASEGYNVCLFAYGQTGTGKTYTMMGAPDSMGLTPRICQGLFTSDDSFPEGHNSSRVEISFLEIYNERVRDLLRGGEQKKIPLRVREHPDKGPYVQDLSHHVVSDYKQAVELLEEGIANRITAATHIHDASSRSHAIFTIQYTQAILENNLPSEIVSKINLVDLAGSERADPHYCRDRLTEGSNINKSLVTLGIVISALAQNSQMSSSCQSIDSVASEGDGGRTVGSHSGCLSGGGEGRRRCFIPYRDSVLTWLLKDSLGGNSKTIMIATVSPSCRSYNETLSTLRYAAHARNIVNRPRVNEDASVRLIRELREEIDRLKSMLLSYEMQRNPSPSLSDERDGSLLDVALQNELKSSLLQVDQLTKDWSESWREKKELLEKYSVDINRDPAGFLIHSLVPHLITLDRDILSTGVTFYHLREGITRIGPQDELVDPQIVLQGGANCEIENHSGVVTLRPLPGSVCVVNDREVMEPCRLAQGSVVILGGVHKFRFNHPAEAAVLRERRRASEGTLSCSSGDLCALMSEPRVEVPAHVEDLEGKEPPLGQQCEEDQVRSVEEQRGYVECLRQEIHIEQRRAERDLEREQAHLRQQHIDIQQWILQENQRLAAITLEQKETRQFGVQTDPITVPILDNLPTHGSKGSKKGFGQTVALPSEVVLDRKRVVQEELLHHHALRRAESRVRRKRLQYQLQRIAHKRHLLESKRELQRLEKALPSYPVSASPEQGCSSRSRGRQPDLRRHSFSSDLLSRLYPKHTPIFSHFLKKSDLTFGSIGSRRWVSDECIPRERKRSHSNTFSSETGQSCQEPGFRSSASSLENHKSPGKDKALAHSPCRERPEKKSLLPKRVLELTCRNNQNALQSQHQGTSSNGVVKEPGVIVRKFNSQTLKNLPRGGSKGLENIRNVLSRSVGPGIKTALARIFRNPPSRLSGGARLTKPLAKTASGFLWKQNRGAVDSKMNRKTCMMKTTVSCEDLAQETTFHICKQRHRKWHSAETLMSKTSTLKWVEKQLILGPAGWEDCDGEEEKSGGELSDCDSLLSVDSLSSAYATALAEQLVQEEAIQSEADSEDGQMSKDSLAVESRGKHDVSKRAQRLTKAVLSQSVVRDFQKPLIGKTMNVVSDIQLIGGGVTDVSSETGGNGAACESVYRMQSVTESSFRDTKLSEESEHIHVLTSNPGSLSSCSAREPEDHLELTDAWSSIDAADSPRIPRETMLRRMVFSHGGLDSSSDPSPINVDLPDCPSGFCATRSHSSASTDCTERECVRVEKQRFKLSLETTDTLNLPDSQLHQTLAPHVKARLNQEQMCCEGHFERPLVSSEGLPVSIESTGFCDNQSRDFTSEHTLCSSTNAPTIDYSIQDMPSKLEDARFNWSQMQLTLPPEVLFVGVADQKSCTDAGLYPQSPHSKASMETYPKTKGEMGSNESNCKNASNIPLEDNEQCYIDGDMVLIRDEEFSETSKTKDKSLKMLQKLETKSTDQNCASTEQEFFNVSCKKSRKRNKVLKDSFIGILKMPKRSNAGDFLTPSTSQENSPEIIWSDDNNNTSTLKDKQTFPLAHALKQNLDCKQCHFKRDTSTSVEMSVFLDVSHQNMSLCSPNIVDTVGHKSLLVEEEAVIEKKIEVERDDKRPFDRQNKKLISGSRRRDFENCQRGHHHAESNCIPIDQRISEVVKEHMRMSVKYWAGGNSNSELDSESSPNLNVLPTCHSNICDLPKDLHPIENHVAAGLLEIITPDSISQQSLISSERLSIDGTIDMTKVSHGKDFAHYNSLTVTSVNQPSNITKDFVSRQDSSETKILSDSQLSPIIQGKDVTINVDIRGDNSQDVSGFTVVTLNDQASYNSGAACLADKSHENILNLALDNHKGCPENIHKPKLLPTRWSIFTLETPKDCSVCQENVLERDVPFLNMDNVITFSGNNNKQTVNQNCSLQQTLKPRGTMSEALPNIVFAHEKDIFVDSEHDILKNQYQMTSACASGQLDLHVFHHHEALESLSDKGSLKLTIENTEIHNSQRLANNLPSVESIKMLTVNQTEKRDRGHACVRKELQRDTHCATNISQDLPKSDSSSETQVDTIHKICVIVDPDHKKKHQRLKRDKCHVEKWLKAQCNVANFASKQTKDCQMAKNENVSITETQLAKCPVTRLDGPSEINTTDPLPSQRTQECSDVNRKILGDICRDIISKEKHTKTSKCPILHRFTGSSVINCNKEKSKKFRRSKAHAPPSSSCNSTIKSSSDEEEDITPRQHPSKSLSTRMMPRTQTKGKLKEVIHGNGEARYQSKSQSPHSKDNTNMEACAGWNLGKYGNSNVTINVGQKDHYPNGQSAQALAMSSGLKDTQMSHHTTKPQDSAMHFASSDVNPFVHQWKEQQIQKCYKNQVFGSAADISCKSLLPDPTDKRITRCCSVDNGLNLQNCPFNSHLSTYANNKGLSSTLSSMEEYFKDQTSPKAHHEGHANQVSGVDNQNKPLIQNVNVSSSCTDVPGDPGNSSGQVDEIMLVCCSEQESQCNRFRIPETHNTQDHSTQTSINPVTMTQTTINHGNIQRNNSLRRNSTPVTVSQNTKETNKETTTWASLQNMSEHLSQLIHNTSDLLGNVQGMRSGDSNLKQSPIRNGTSSHLYSFKDWKKHCSTQAAVDIGIQTESTAIQDKMSSHQTLYTERPTNHEVNVIVKVIGSEVLNVSQNQLKNRQDDTFQSMPDLQINSCPFNQTSVLEPESFPHKFPSIATVEHNNHSNPAIRHKSNECCEPKILSCSKGLAVTAACNDFPEIVKLESPNVLRRSDPGISYRKQVSFTDRACSPILTVGPRSNSNKSLKEHQHVEMQKISQEYLMQCSECQSTPCLSYGGQEACRSFTKNDQMPGHNSLDQSEMSWDISMIKSAGSISLENVSALRLSGPKGSDGCPESPSLSIDQYIPDETSVVTCEKERESTRWSVPSVLSSNAVTQGNHVAAFKQDEESISTLGHRRSYRRHLSEGPSESSSGVYQPSPIGDYPIQFQEDDMLSPAPSECNTDVLLNINPVTQTFNIQHHSPQPGNPELPVDLPVHNKFTNWSGISQHPSDRGKTKRSVNSAAHIPPAHEAQRNQADWTALHGQESGCSPSPGYPFENDKHTRPHMRPRLSLSPESSFSKDRKRREIERLRQEREQVMATVHLDMNHNPLTVELTEAKLHHGRGETDTLLKMLASGEPKVGEPSAVLTKQQLYDRHRRSIDGLRQEREARLQTCRRARSLSPGKHHSPQSPQSKTPPQEAVFSRVPALPSRRRDYLQQLRQEVVASSRIPGPPRGEGHYPSEIEQLLRDYGRAREEARTEIARARDRLRERTEQEKRRLQKQALSQVVKDDLQYRTRVSNSTLCTGSSLSLSSGPTSGYNSGYTVQRMDDSRPSLTLQAAAVLDDGLNGLKVRSRPPLRSSQTLKPQRAWLSAQDVRLEPAVPGSDPLMSSYPPSPSSLRRRTASFGSASSISTAYQDLASCLLGRALAEVRLAAAGNMENLVMGKVAAGWRYHGVERGVQAFYKPSSSPSVHSFMGAVELERPLASLWSMVQDHSKIHLYQEAVRSTWTQPLDDCTQLVYLLTETSSCHLKHPRDFCCISTVSQQDELCVLAMQSVFEESLPRPHVEAVRGEMLPSAWVLQATTRHGREVVRVIYLLQVDLGSPSLPQRLLGTVARRQAAVLAELDSLFSL